MDGEQGGYDASCDSFENLLVLRCTRRSGRNARSESLDLLPSNPEAMPRSHHHHRLVSYHPPAATS